MSKKFQLPFLKSGALLLCLWFPFQLSGQKATNKTSEKKQKVKPDYAVVFPKNKVNRIDIVIKTADWDTLINSLSKKIGKPGNGFMPGPPPGMFNDSFPGRDRGRMMPPPGMDSLRKMHPPQFSGKMPPFPGGKFGGPGGFRPPFSNNKKDTTVRCTVLFNGGKWEYAGFRVKGNSSLMMSYSQNIKKLPFRLHFTKYADSTSTEKQLKFYGFKELSFTNNINDLTFMREKLAGDLFREGGVKAAHSAFYEVYIDKGEGPEYFGLYSTIEIIEDNMLKEQFGSDKGNCYKPDMPGGSLAKDVFDKKSMVKKTNKKKADWNDVEQLYTLLHSDLRQTQPEQWQLQLEEIFDVPVFLKWLAINTVIENWDTYGSMPHNYYLYNNPGTGKLTWIPWDNNEALNHGRMGTLNLSLSDVNENWPLIRYLLDLPKYNMLYKAEIKQFASTVFIPENLKQKISKYQILIEPSVKKEVKNYTFQQKDTDFNTAITDLQKHIEARYALALKYLEEK